MTGNNGGPWGGGNRGNSGNGKRPAGETPQIPEIDELVKKGQEQLRVMLGGRGGGTGAAPLIFRDHISVPTIPALARARAHLWRGQH